jgi:leucyl-tRNA synthetase
MTEQIYNPSDIEPKWQARWEADGLYNSDIARQMGDG